MFGILMEIEFQIEMEQKITFYDRDIFWTMHIKYIGRFKFVDK